MDRAEMSKELFQLRDFFGADFGECSSDILWHGSDLGIGEVPQHLSQMCPARLILDVVGSPAESQPWRDPRQHASIECQHKGLI